MYVQYGIGIATMITSAGPMPIGGIQEFSANIKFTKKKAYGAFQFPLAVARGEGELTWKAKSVMFSGAMIGAVLTGSTTAAGTKIPIVSEPAVVPAASPYTVTASKGANYKDDLGVLDLNRGTFLTPVASGPAAGQYIINPATGLYTYAAADTGHVIALNYSYGSTTLGHTTTYTNQLMGSGATVALDLFNPNPNNGSPMGLKIFATIVDGLDLAFKNNDFTMTDLSGEAFADPNNFIFETYYVD